MTPPPTDAVSTPEDPALPRSSTLQCGGAIVEVRAPRDVLEACLELLAREVAVTTAGAQPHAVVTVDPTYRTVTTAELPTTRAADATDLVRSAASVAQLQLAAHATEAVFVHAGAVSYDGVGIVIPGRSMAGKTTLVRALVEAGATYYSDEYAVLDHSGNLSPFAKPMSVRSEGTSTIVPLDSIDRVGSDPVRVGVVASLRFADSGPWPPDIQRGAVVALQLVENAVAARSRPNETLDAASAVAREALLVAGPRPDAPKAARWILEELVPLAARRDR